MHKTEIKDIGSFNKDVNCCFIYNALMKKKKLDQYFQYLQHVIIHMKK